MTFPRPSRRHLHSENVFSAQPQGGAAVPMSRSPGAGRLCRVWRNRTHQTGCEQSGRVAPESLRSGLHSLERAVLPVQKMFETRWDSPARTQIKACKRPGCKDKSVVLESVKSSCLVSWNWEILLLCRHLPLFSTCAFLLL